MPGDRAIYTAKSLYQTYQYKYNTQHLKYNAELLIVNAIHDCDIVCDYLPVRTNSFCGMLTIDEDETSILINANHPKQRRLFTIAHELGHYFLHRHQQSQFMDEHKNVKEDINTMMDNTINTFEVEANLFASEIMIPEFVLQSMLNFKFNYFRISKTTGCSYESLKWRLVRYLYEKYSLDNDISEKLVEDYRKSSIRKNPEGSVIFALAYSPNPHEYAHKLLEEKEKRNKENYHFWF